MDVVTRRLGMFPLSVVLFPHEELPLHVFEPRYRKLVTDCLAKEREFGVVLIARGSEVGGGDERFDLGTIAYLEAASRFPDGRWALVVRGTRRIRITEWLEDDPYPLALVEELPEIALENEVPELAAARAAVPRSRAILSELGDSRSAQAAPAVAPEQPFDKAGWSLCALAPLNPLDADGLLRIDDPVERLSAVTLQCSALADDLGRLLSDG